MKSIVSYSAVPHSSGSTPQKAQTMDPISLALKIALGTLMVDAIIETAFISSMVRWLHTRAGRDFEIEYNGSTFPLHGKPETLLLDAGHVSNGAAGTALILIGFGGILALFLQSHAARSGSGSFFATFARTWYRTWLWFTVVSALFTLSALVSVFVIDAKHASQTIAVALAARLDNRPYPNYVAYPLDTWTPPAWFTAVLQLDLANSSDRSDIESRLRVMHGWAYNLIPLFILGVVVSVLAFVEASHRRRRQLATVAFEEKRDSV